MIVFLAVAAGAALLFLVLGVFANTDASRIAASLRTAGPLALVLIGVAILAVGAAGFGGILIAGGLALFAATWPNKPARKKTIPQRKRSTVRTAALEMELDHDTGALEGLVLAGRHEQRRLGTMALRELVEVYADLKSDSESRQLLETYLDGRFPVWRERTNAHRGDGKGVAPSAGPMTKQEAYKVLGLEAGASPADIRQAHRRLMQRLNPDLGRAPLLAARINEAKDILLAKHH